MAIIGPSQPTQPACTSKWRCRFLCVRVFHTIWSINVQWNADNREKVGTWRNFPITNYLAIILSQKQCVLSYSTTFSTSFFLRGRLNLPGISFIDLILQFRGRINSLDFFFLEKKPYVGRILQRFFASDLKKTFFASQKSPEQSVRWSGRMAPPPRWLEVTPTTSRFENWWRSTFYSFSPIFFPKMTKTRLNFLSLLLLQI